MPSCQGLYSAGLTDHHWRQDALWHEQGMTYVTNQWPTAVTCAHDYAGWLRATRRGAWWCGTLRAGRQSSAWRILFRQPAARAAAPARAAQSRAWHGSWPTLLAWQSSWREAWCSSGMFKVRVSPSYWEGAYFMDHRRGSQVAGLGHDKTLLVWHLTWEEAWCSSGTCRV